MCQSKSSHTDGVSTVGLEASTDLLGVLLLAFKMESPGTSEDTTQLSNDCNIHQTCMINDNSHFSVYSEPASTCRTIDQWNSTVEDKFASQLASMTPYIVWNLHYRL